MEQSMNKNKGKSFMNLFINNNLVKNFANDYPKINENSSIA